MTLKKGLLIGAKVAVSVALIAYLSTKIDLGAAADRIATADWALVAGAVTLLFLQNVIGSFRWWIVLRTLQTPAPISYLKALLFFFIGIFFNQALPSTVGGDVVRIYKTRRAGVKLGVTVNSVMLERAGTVLALILMVIAVLPAFLPRIGEAEAAWIAPASGVLLVVALAGLGFLMILDRLPENLTRFRLIQGLVQLAVDARRVFLSPIPAFSTIGVAAIGHFNLCLGVYLLALSLDINVTLIDCVALFLPVLLVMTLPISIAGWGLREGAMVAAFALISVPETSAFALSILFGLINVAAAIPAGIAFLLSGDGHSLSDMEHEVEDGEAALQQQNKQA